MLYAEWRACERFGILPPGFRPKREGPLSWDDLDVVRRCELIGYDQIRSAEDVPVGLML